MADSATPSATCGRTRDRPMPTDGFEVDENASFPKLDWLVEDRLAAVELLRHNLTLVVDAVTLDLFC